MFRLQQTLHHCVERPRVGALQKLAQLGLRQQTHEVEDGLAAAERDHGGNGLNAVLPGELRVLIDVDLGEDNLSLALADHFLENGREGAAWSAPRRPEIHHHRRLVRAVNHLLIERAIFDFDDPGRLGRGHGVPPVF